LNKRSIILINYGSFEKEITEWICEDISITFGYRASTLESSRDLSEFYSPARRQYDANGIISMVSGMAPEDSLKIIGLFQVDLFIPILTYIFGQATLSGKTAIASIYRLRNELYGLSPNYMLQIERLRKVVIHELGHTFGLIHCHHPGCVMIASTYVENIDNKSIQFCQSCKSGLVNKHDG
jgi:archaemetzincin